MKDALLENDILFFFDRKPAEFELYKQVEKKILDEFPDTKIEVKKTQISFKSRYMFSCVSLPKTKKGMPPNGIDDFDEELFGWIKEVHEFSNHSHRR